VIVEESLGVVIGVVLFPLCALYRMIYLDLDRPQGTSTALMPTAASTTAPWDTLSHRSTVTLSLSLSLSLSLAFVISNSFEACDIIPGDVRLGHQLGVQSRYSVGERRSHPRIIRRQHHERQDISIHHRGGILLLTLLRSR
jgi:hypothetical protein